MSFSSNLPESRPVHERVIHAVADVEDVGPTDLDPLYETIDPEALDTLFKPDVGGRIEFTYEGHDVVVHADGDAVVDGTQVDVAPFQPIAVGEEESGTNTAGQ